MFTTRAAAAALAALVAAAACSSSHPGRTSAPPSTRPAESSATTAGSPASTAAAAPSTAAAAGGGVAAAWPTYHATNDRAGSVPGVTRPATLTMGWTARLDGEVYAQPLVVGDTVIVATENDTVYAFSLRGGPARWQVHLGSPQPRAGLECGNVDPLGITGTPAYDATTGSLFVVTETAGASHDLVALDARTGAKRFSRNLDVGGHSRLAEQQRGALAVAGGRVYVPFGGLFGDCGDYVGYVAAVATDGSGTVAHWSVPTAREGGMWAPSGVAVASDGTVFVSAGNGAAQGGAYDGSDAVIRLSADLSTRLDFFAPSSWAADNASDRDLGSTGPLLLPGGLVVVSGKSGTVYLLRAGALGGIGGQMASLNGCAGYGGMAADAGAVFVPCSEGVQRIDVTPGKLAVRWRVSATGSPVVGGGAVWALDDANGALFAYDELSGTALAHVKVGDVTRFATPVLAGAQVFVGTTEGLVAVAIS